MSTPSAPRDDSLRQYLIEEFLEDYREGHMSRRDALKRLVGLTASVALSNALLAACAPAAVPTATVAAPTTVPNTLPPPTTAPTTAATTAATATSAATATTAVTATGEATAATTATAAAPDATLTTSATATVTPGDTSLNVSPDDPAIRAEMVQFPSRGATIRGYLARPSAEGTYPAILVSHENRGLTEHIQDVTRRLAKAGFVALAVDLLSRQGGTAQVGEAQVPGVLGNTPPEQMVGDFAAGLEYLKQQPFVAKGKFGMVGFCFGGGMTWRAATQMPELVAVVPYYGPNPPLEDVPKINAAVLAHYGGNDSRINAGIPDIEKAMKDNNKTFQYYVYEGAGHAFNNDTGSNYNAQAAQQAWQRTLDWFNQYLKS